jgi:hypothetical protein
LRANAVQVPHRIGQCEGHAVWMIVPNLRVDKSA